MIVKKNIHSIERIVRVLIGLVLLSMTIIGPKSPWFFLGVIPLLTGFVGWCPPYAMLGISTCKLKE